MRAPFPWFGGKSRAAELVWGGFGDVANYVEPFAGSLAVLLARPHAPRIETVNDLDCYLSNFWRAVKNAPEEVASWADWPVNEADLHARHRWLVGQEEFRLRLRREPTYFDARIAGWWVWGICQWIGSGWCTNPEGTGRRARGVNVSEQAARPNLSGDKGVHRRSRDLTGAAGWEKRPRLGEKLPRAGLTAKLPNVSSGFGNGTGHGVHASGKPLEAIGEWMLVLADRLRRVRVCCGDWRRVLGRSATECIGVTGILLDPPYGEAAGRDPSLYAEESLSVAQDVRDWALEHGANKKLRIALCGYEGEHEMPKDWQCVEWKAGGGYAGAAGNTENASRERIWFSPHCQRARAQASLFGAE